MSTDQILLELVSKHKGVLKKYAFSLTKDREEAEDLLQDTIVIILKKAHLYKEQTYFKSWSCTIMRNLFINNYRKNKNVSFTELSDAENNDFDFNTGENNLNVEAIHDSIKELKEDYKEIIILRLQGYKFMEIEEKLDISCGKLRSMYFKGIRVLRNKLALKFDCNSYTIKRFDSFLYKQLFDLDLF